VSFILNIIVALLTVYSKYNNDHNKISPFRMFFFELPQSGETGSSSFPLAKHEHISASHIPNAL
jgi:hypothetical protein